MIEVIREPIVEIPREIFCPNSNCQAILRYRQADIQHNYGTQRDRVPEDKQHYIIGPRCGHIIYVKW